MSSTLLARRPSAVVLAGLVVAGCAAPKRKPRVRPSTHSGRPRRELVERRVRGTDRRAPGTSETNPPVRKGTPADAAVATDVQGKHASVEKQAASPNLRVPPAKTGALFDDLPLVDEVNCGDPDEGHPFREAPGGASEVRLVLGRPCRVIPNTGKARYFAYLIGKGKGLKAGAAYVLAVDFPEDRPRDIFILNRGAEIARGVHTGAALGDVLYTYTNNNAESLKIPLSGRYRTWRTLFHLHDRLLEFSMPRGRKWSGKRSLRPKDGFWVIISQGEARQDPINAGAAASSIRLYRVPDPERYYVKLNMPPEGLPRRHIFWREEMSDGVVGGDDPGVAEERDWFEYRARLMRFLGVNTYCKDLLEFGHNQGWDTSGAGGNDWYWSSKTPRRWQNILDIAAKYDLYALPYYEWAGGTGRKGLGKERRCRTLGGKRTYTHIKWSEKMNVDVTDPEALADARKLLDATVIRHKDRARLIGAWFRTRPSMMPISFSDRCCGLFAEETGARGEVTRRRLREDAVLLDRYYDWWFGKRKGFLVALRDHLRANLSESAVLLFTPYSEEPGPPLEGGKQVVTDDVSTWWRLLRSPDQKKIKVAGYEEVVTGGRHLRAALGPMWTWGRWEWQHSVPRADPARYRDTEGVLMTYPFNRAYTAASPAAFDAFRTAAGLAVVRHFSLNENTMHQDIGYFASDVERPGPYVMLAEARALAYGDPRYIGYLAAHSFNTGFPEHVRAFNAAFMSLPALPSEVLNGACALRHTQDACVVSLSNGACAEEDVVVRLIRTEEHGTYVAVVNVALEPREAVILSLPVRGRVSDAASGRQLGTSGGRLRVSLYPCELRALRIQ